MNSDIINKFTIHLRNTISRSIDLAWELKEENIPPLFLFASIIEQQESLGAKLLTHHHVSREHTSKALHERSKRVMTATKTPEKNNTVNPLHTQQDLLLFLWPEFSHETKKAIEYATRLALEHGQQYIGTEHLLLGLLHEKDMDVQKILQSAHVSSATLERQLHAVIQMTHTLSSKHSQPSIALEHTMETETTENQEVEITTLDDTSKTPQPTSDTPALDFFGTDLTSKTHTAKLDPVIGRVQEIDRIIHILLRRTKNNPILIGEPGVGKTAIIEGLARNIANRNVPSILLDKRIIALDMGLIVAGTMYRGEFESRIKQIIEEVTQRPEIILFIDEIHTLVGAGSVGHGNGSLDAANIFKPALAKGLLHCIGATTLAEYQRSIESDAALDRRFQSILVREPSLHETIDILKGLRPYYEQFHRVHITNEALQAAAQLADRYIPEKHMPDKAIDLLDEAGATIAAGYPVPQELPAVRRYERLLRDVRQQKDEASRTEQFQTAINLKRKEERYETRLRALTKRLARFSIPTVKLDTQDIARVVAQATSIPLQHIERSNNASHHRDLTQHLREHIVGQNHAIDHIVNVIMRSDAGLHAPHRPLGTFLFLGPSGVGKTELAKVLATMHYGNPDALIRIDCSQLSEGYSVSKLLGAPAGYVGYKESVKLSDRICRQPYSLLLFDELEKAHPDIHNVLLQILDEGKLTDAAGRELHFRNSIIILTSTVGIDLFTKQAAMGFGATERTVSTPNHKELESNIFTELRECFRDEFLNRIDQTIIFNPLQPKDVERIVDIQFEELCTRLQERGMNARLTNSARRYIATQSFRPEQGARGVRKFLLEHVETPLAMQIVRGSKNRGTIYTVKVSKKHIVIHKT